MTSGDLKKVFDLFAGKFQNTWKSWWNLRRPLDHVWWFTRSMREARLIARRPARLEWFTRPDKQHLRNYFFCLFWPEGSRRFLHKLPAFDWRNFLVSCQLFIHDKATNTPQACARLPWLGHGYHLHKPHKPAWIFLFSAPHWNASVFLACNLKHIRSSAIYIYTRRERKF